MNNSKLEKLETKTHNVLDKLEPIVDRINLMASNTGSSFKGVTDSISTINETGATITSLYGQYNESKRLDIEMQTLQNELVGIVSNHKTEIHVINQIFSERRNVIDKLFDVIDKGLLNSNDQLVFMSMNLINATLERNPLLMLKDYKNNIRKIDFNDDKPLELDF